MEIDPIIERLKHETRLVNPQLETKTNIRGADYTVDDNNNNNDAVNDDENHEDKRVDDIQQGEIIMERVDEHDDVYHTSNDFTHNTLEKYKDYLDAWMETVDIKLFDKPFVGREKTFSYLFSRLCVKSQSSPSIRVLQLGATKSYCDVMYTGYQSTDQKYWNANDLVKWDYTNGMFSYLLAEYLQANELCYHMHIVDQERANIERCKHVTKDFGKHIRYWICESVHFLRITPPKPYNLIYIDTAHLTPVETLAEKQLEQVQKIVERNLVTPGGYIVFDDVRNPIALTFDNKKESKNYYGQAKYSIPYLLQQGYVKVMDEYQVIMQKPISMSKIPSQDEEK